MKLYFVRHGKTEWNGSGRMTGQTDVPLIEEGIQQAEATAKNLPKGISVFYSSDLIRCKQTAEILNKELQLTIEYDSRLRERDFGSLAGSAWKEIDPDGTLRAKDVAQQYDYRPYGGEAIEDVKMRALSFVEDMKAKHPEEVVLIVSSAGFIRLLHHLLGEPREKITNGSIHEFVIDV